MKQKDLTLIVVIIFISGIFSFVASRFLIAPPSNRVSKVEVVEKISADFQVPEKKFFNENSLNPTKTIQIGGNGNTAPFQSE